MKKDIHQRRAFALRRVSRAVDRMIVATAQIDKERAARWVQAWARVAGLEKVGSRVRVFK